VSEKCIVFADEDIKIDFFAAFDAKYQAFEYLRTSILINLKQSREFIKTKSTTLQRVNPYTGENEIMLDYKKFVEYGISIKSNSSWHPVKLEGLEEFEINLGDMLLNLFKQYVNFSVTSIIAECETLVNDKIYEIKLLTAKLQNPTLQKDHKLIQSQIDNHNKLIDTIQRKITKVKNESTVEQFVNQEVIKIMGEKILTDESKLISQESQELSKSEQEEESKN